MSTLWNDIKYGLRMLGKNPGFTALAVLTLGLGIGAASTLFGVFDSLVLDPFPYPDSGRIVHVWSNEGQPLSAPDFLDIREQNTSFAQIGAYTPQRVNLGLDRPEPGYAARCTAGVLAAFGMPPALGRWLATEDERPGASPVAVVSHSLWTRLFAGDPKAVGRTIRLDGRETMIVGVMPPSFEFHSPWYAGHDCEIWVPLPLESQGRGNHWLVCVGRLKDGVTLQAADAEIKTIGQRLAQAHPETNLYKPFLVRSLRADITQRTASGTYLLLGAVALLLIVACANVASMILARGTQRQAEFGVRLALGATRGDVARLLLSESLLLALLGCAVGILFSAWGIAGMKRVIPPQLIIEARRAALQVDGRVLLFSMGLALVTVLLFGLLPALTAARTAVVETLKEGGRSQAGSRIRHRFLRHLVIGQIALSLVLANVAILLARSYLNVLQTNRALNSPCVLTTEIALQGRQYDEGDARMRFWEGLFERIKALPAVHSAAITTKMPLEGGINATILVEGETYDPTVGRPAAEFSHVSPDYFAAMGIPVLRGRPPEADDAPHEFVGVGVAVNQALVERYWPGQDPIGKRIQSNDSAPWFKATIIGVVGDVHQSAEHPALPEIYFPYAVQKETSITLVVRAATDAHALVPLLRQVLAELDRNLPLANIRTMRDVVGGSVSGRRMTAQLIGVFIVAALAATGVGIYGTLSYNLLQRRREIGVRMALGAMPRHVLNVVFRQAGSWVLAGLAIGLTLTAAAAMLLRSAVYGIKPLDPLSLLLGLGIVGGVAVAACLLPARRAARIDPMEALRCE